jgi:hypothetical protein
MSLFTQQFLGDDEHTLKTQTQITIISIANFANNNHKRCSSGLPPLSFVFLTLFLEKPVTKLNVI